MKKPPYTALLLIALVFWNCRSAKTVSSEASVLNLSSKDIIKRNTKQTPKFKTLAARIRITIIEGTTEKSYTLRLRMEKDRKIWISSAPISIIKALMTPSQVQFYNRLDNTYSQGDYRHFSELLGVSLDFKKAQNLLLGEALLDLKKTPSKTFVAGKMYGLEPIKQAADFNISYRLDPALFKIESQHIAQAKKQRTLKIEYLKHQKINHQILPEQIKIVGNAHGKERIINLEFKNIALNEALRFPFKIPSGFSKKTW